MCSCSQKSNISNLPTASLCCAGSITYKCIGKIQNMKVYLYRPQFENVHFLWVNNASTSFFTHFYSINFIYTAYFAWNYFIFTSYMKYFRLWSFSIVTVLICRERCHYPPPACPGVTIDYEYLLSTYFKWMAGVEPSWGWAPLGCNFLHLSSSLTLHSPAPALSYISPHS